MKMSKKCRNNSDNPLTFRLADRGKNIIFYCELHVNVGCYDNINTRSAFFKHREHELGMS